MPKLQSVPETFVSLAQSGRSAIGTSLVIGMMQRSNGPHSYLSEYVSKHACEQLSVSSCPEFTQLGLPEPGSDQVVIRWSEFGG